MSKSTTLRIWLDADKKFGHVSLQTGNAEGNQETRGISDEGIYVSIYPVVATYGVDGVRFTTKTLAQDNQKYKDKFPPIIVILETLNSEEIENRYRGIIASDPQFSLFASTYFRQQPELADLPQNIRETYNCCWLVFQLLKAGNIDSFAEHINIFSISTPALFSILLPSLGASLSLWLKMASIGRAAAVCGWVGGILLSSSSSPEAIEHISASTLGAVAGGLPGHIIGSLYADIISNNLFLYRMIGQGFIAPKWLFLGLAISIGVFPAVTTLVGIVSGEKLRYLTSLFWFDQKWLFTNKQDAGLGSIIIRSLPVIAILVRLTRILPTSFNSLVDVSVKAALLDYLLRGTFLTLAGFHPVAQEMILKELDKMHCNNIPNLTEQAKGEKFYHRLVTFGGALGTLLFGLGCGYTTSVGLFGMYQTSRQINHLLQQVVFSPSDIVDLATSAQRVENKILKKEQASFSARLYGYLSDNVSSFFGRGANDNSRALSLRDVSVPRH